MRDILQLFNFMQIKNNCRLASLYNTMITNKINRFLRKRFLDKFFFRPTVKNQFLPTFWALSKVKPGKLKLLERIIILVVLPKDHRFVKCSGFIKILGFFS